MMGFDTFHLLAFPIVGIPKTCTIRHLFVISITCHCLSLVLLVRVGISLRREQTKRRLWSRMVSTVVLVVGLTLNTLNLRRIFTTFVEKLVLDQLYSQALLPDDSSLRARIPTTRSDLHKPIVASPVEDRH